MNINQNTIESSVSLEGYGLHTGSHSKITFKPAEANSGIFFIRTDLPEKNIIPALLENVSHANRGTTLAKDSAKVHTVEHVLSAVYGMGIDNLCIELSGEEPPACDGSSTAYVELLQKAGIKSLAIPANYCELKETFWIEQNGKTLAYLPSDKFEITFTIHYPETNILQQTAKVIVNEKEYAEYIGKARTFGFVEEYEELKAHGLARGGNLENAIVLDHNGKILNPEGLRHEKEFVLHKILDLIGDLSLIGRRIRGHIVAFRTGHSINVKFAKVLQDKWKKQEERKNLNMMNIEQIKEVLPHRYPFLLVDKILSIVPGESAIGIKNVTANEEFFNGHFPGKPVMPGVLLVEAMAQVAGVLFLSQPEHKGKLPYFVGIDKVRFRKPVVPGDRLEFTAKTLKIRGNTGKVECEARVDGDLVASGELMFTIL